MAKSSKSLLNLAKRDLQEQACDFAARNRRAYINKYICLVSSNQAGGKDALNSSIPLLSSSRLGLLGMFLVDPLEESAEVADVV